MKYRFPLVLGNDLSGVVSDVGSRVTRFKKDDVVYARVDKDRIGTFAEFAVVRDGAAVPTSSGRNGVYHRGATQCGTGEASRRERHKARYEYFFVHADGEQLREIARLVESGAITPLMDKVFRLHEVRDALAYSESGRATGKVVIKVV